MAGALSGGGESSPIDRVLGMSFWRASSLDRTDAISPVCPVFYLAGGFGESPR
jgi:hypothetical protein